MAKVRQVGEPGLVADARVGECARLDAGDFAVTARADEVRLHGRGDEVRSVPLSGPARKLVSAWLDVCGCHPGPAWTGQRGPLTGSRPHPGRARCQERRQNPRARATPLSAHLHHATPPGRHRPCPGPGHARPRLDRHLSQVLQGPVRPRTPPSSSASSAANEPLTSPGVQPILAGPPCAYWGGPGAWPGTGPDATAGSGLPRCSPGWRSVRPSAGRGWS